MANRVAGHKTLHQVNRSKTMMSSSGRRKRVVPVSFQVAGYGLNILSRIHNEWSAKVLSQIWFTVFKSKPKLWVDDFWAQADKSITIQLADKTIPVYSWGAGPLVVLMHGWSGSGTQFRRFIPELVGAGYQVITFDAPGHGRNPGRQSHLLEFSDSLMAIQQQVGDIDTVIAHSLGGMATTVAIQRGLKPQKLVMIAPHLDVQKIFESYRDLLNLRPALANRFHALIGQKMYDILDQQDPWSTMKPSALLNDKTPAGMLVYDNEDEEVEAEIFKQIEATWKDCYSVKTDNLGHNKILKDESVIQSILLFLTSKQPA